MARATVLMTIILIVGLQLVKGAARANDEEMLLCSKTQIKFGLGPPGLPRQAFPQGPPGKRGAPGERGPPGNPTDRKIIKSLSNEVNEILDDVREIKMTSSRPNPGVTLVSHNSEGDFFVDGCEPAGCYKRVITYEMSLRSIRTLISGSRFCRQYIKYQCHGSILYANHDKSPDRRAWWVSGTGVRVNRWGSASADYTCECADQGTCVPGFNCNCDRNDGVWRADEGYITDKGLLPVTELHFGDIGDTREMGIHTLGKLECYS